MWRRPNRISHERLMVNWRGIFPCIAWQFYKLYYVILLRDAGFAILHCQQYFSPTKQSVQVKMSHIYIQVYIYHAAIIYKTFSFTFLLFRFIRKTDLISTKSTWIDRTWFKLVIKMADFFSSTHQFFLQDWCRNRIGYGKSYNRLPSWPECPESLRKRKKTQQKTKNFYGSRLTFILQNKDHHSWRYSVSDQPGSESVPDTNQLTLNKQASLHQSVEFAYRGGSVPFRGRYGHAEQHRDWILYVEESQNLFELLNQPDSVSPHIVLLKQNPMSIDQSRILI